MITKACVFLLLSFSFLRILPAQINPDLLGSWYMYFWSANLPSSQWGFQGDMQYRNWAMKGDLEQLLLRGGITYQPKEANVKFTGGYAHIQSGMMGQSRVLKQEHRLYQEALIPQKVGNRYYLRHRFRYEQRWLEDQDRRTRFRYAVLLNIPLNSTEIEASTMYLALSNETFLNGERTTGTGKNVEIFDRNRAYVALGYAFNQQMMAQVGFMEQTTDALSKGQVQVSFHHTW